MPDGTSWLSGAMRGVVGPAKPVVAPVSPKDCAKDVADIRIGLLDARGQTIEDVYAVFDTHWAVYRADRVAIHYSDNVAEQDEQRSGVIQALGTERAEFLGLLERLDPPDRKPYDAALANAFIAALQADAGAKRTITDAIGRLNEELRGRQSYDFVQAGLRRFLLTFIPLLALVAALAWFLDVRPPAERHAVLRAHAMGFGAALIGGLLGAVFSAATGLRGRALVLAGDVRTNRLDAGLRLVVGGIAGVVLYLVLTVGGPLFVVTVGGAAPGAVTGGAVTGTRPGAWPAILLFGFLAGFAERLVPSLLGKAAGRLGGEDAK